jgi:hypothetical protein
MGMRGKWRGTVRPTHPSYPTKNEKRAFKMGMPYSGGTLEIKRRRLPARMGESVSIQFKNDYLPVRQQRKELGLDDEFVRNLKRGTRIVEIGFGSGRLAAWLAPKVGKDNYRAYEYQLPVDENHPEAGPRPAIYVKGRLWRMREKILQSQTLNILDIEKVKTVLGEDSVDRLLISRAMPEINWPSAAEMRLTSSKAADIGRKLAPALIAALKTGGTLHYSPGGQVYHRVFGASGISDQESLRKHAIHSSLMEALKQMANDGDIAIWATGTEMEHGSGVIVKRLR